MKLPKAFVDRVMMLGMYQAFYEKVCELLKQGCSIDDIAEVAMTVESAIESGAYKSTPEYLNALKGKF